MNADSLTYCFELDNARGANVSFGPSVTIFEDRTGLPARLVVRHGGEVVELPFDPLGPKLCPGCGKPLPESANYENAKAVIEGGLEATIWTDSLYSFQPIYSETVIEDLRAHGIGGFIAHPVRLTCRGRLRHLRLEDAPQYYWCEFTETVDIDRGLYDGFDGDYCATCGRWRPRKGGKVRYGDKCLVPIITTAGPGDFWRIGNLWMEIKFCSRRVVDLARQCGWTGFGFRGVLPRVGRLELEHDDWAERYLEAAKAKYPHLFAPGAPLADSE